MILKRGEKYIFVFCIEIVLSLPNIVLEICSCFFKSYQIYSTRLHNELLILSLHKINILIRAMCR